MMKKLLVLIFFIISDLSFVFGASISFSKNEIHYKTEHYSFYYPQMDFMINKGFLELGALNRDGLYLLLLDPVSFDFDIRLKNLNDDKSSVKGIRFDFKANNFIATLNKRPSLSYVHLKKEYFIAITQFFKMEEEGDIFIHRLEKKSFPFSRASFGFTLDWLSVFSVFDYSQLYGSGMLFGFKLKLSAYYFSFTEGMLYTSFEKESVRRKLDFGFENNLLKVNNVIKYYHDPVFSEEYRKIEYMSAVDFSMNGFGVNREGSFVLNEKGKYHKSLKYKIKSPHYRLSYNGTFSFSIITPYFDLSYRSGVTGIKGSYKLNKGREISFSFSSDFSLDIKFRIQY